MLKNDTDGKIEEKQKYRKRDTLKTQKSKMERKGKQIEKERRSFKVKKKDWNESKERERHKDKINNFNETKNIERVRKKRGRKSLWK